MTTSFTIENTEELKLKLLHWSNQFDCVCALDSHDDSRFDQQFSFVIAIDAIDFFAITPVNLSQFEPWANAQKGILFGHFKYELNHSQHHIAIKENNESLGFFFAPRYLIEIKDNKIFFNRNYPEAFDLLERIKAIALLPSSNKSINIQLAKNKSKEAYVSDIEDIKKKIEAGTFYEINYCMEWHQDYAVIDPISVFYQLNNAARAPFSAFLKIKDWYTLCASPERFMQKKGKKLIAQPIKGTVRRDKTDPNHDEQLKTKLYQSLKERAENIMIVDLMRHDLTPFAVPGSIQVRELFGIYPFEYVHQMISTIEATLIENEDGIKAFLYAFPPGSMTGAPKHEVMKHIEQYESFKRGIFSGSIGYIDENKDFDFNVVIRSIFYNSTMQYLSVKSGGAITYESDPEAEYEECLLKSASLIQALETSQIFQPK